jgi:ABC-type polysaccharide/polyol phosphate export permease
VLFLIYFQTPLQMSELVWFPVVVFVQLVLTLGFALILSALTVHFRDIKDILANVMTLWFFVTPIIYSWQNPPSQIRRFLDLIRSRIWRSPIRRSCISTAPSAT